MTAFWWTVAIAACVGLYFAVRARATGRGDSDVSSDVSAEIAQRADEQNRWAQRGDPRGVYGVEGAELMGRVDPAPDIGAELGKTGRLPEDRGRRIHRRGSGHVAGREAAVLAVGGVRVGVGAATSGSAVAAARC